MKKESFKKIVSLVLMGMFVLTVPLQVFAAERKNGIYINGIQLDKGLIKDGTTYVSLKEIAKILGFNVSWDEKTGDVKMSGNASASVPSKPDLSVGDAEKGMFKVIDDNKKSIIEISRKIWNLKETSTQEFKSSALLEDELEKAGFTVTRGLTGKDPLDGTACEMPTAFLATYEKIKGGPTIGVMMEYDALKMGHGCGHNLIAASGYATALALKSALQTIPGKLVVLGTPAEEWGGPGKVQMLEAGYFDGIDAVLITHPADAWNTTSEVLAIAWPKGEVINFKGVASHASNAPDKGKSALDAAMIFGMSLDMMREHIQTGSQIHYCIMEGGSAPNVVPDLVKMDVYVRSTDTNYLNSMMKRVDDAAKGAALATGTTVDYQWDYPWFSGVPVPTLYNLGKQAAKAMGVPESDIKDTFRLGSSDFGNVGFDVPTINMIFKAAPEGTALHSDGFVAAANSDAGQEAMIQASKALALTGYKLFTKKELLTQIKTEFELNLPGL